jgi:hypothetical protein
MRSLANLQEETISKNIDATSDFDQFRHPADAGNHRIIPLLEVYLWPVRQMRGVFTHASDRGRQLVRQTLGTISGTDQRTERLDGAARRSFVRNRAWQIGAGCWGSCRP